MEGLSDCAVGSIYMCVFSVCIFSTYIMATKSLCLSISASDLAHETAMFAHCVDLTWCKKCDEHPATLNAGSV